MSPLTRRLERLERLLEARREGGCLSCALSRLSEPQAQCDSKECGLRLADLLMTMEEAAHA